MLSRQAPSDAAAIERAVALHMQGRATEAERLYRAILEAQPDHFDALHLLGLLHLQRGSAESALGLISKAIARQPRSAEAHSNLGTVLAKLDRLDEAMASYDRAIAIKPDHVEALVNRGNALVKLGRCRDAIGSYDRALALRPGDASAFYGRGNAQRDLNCLGAALDSFRKAIQIKPDYPEAHFNMSLVLLLMGDYEQGWAEYEWRWKQSQLPPARRFRQPLWLGKEPLSGKTILLHAEQGLGDTIQFCRYARLISERGARVLLEVAPSLTGLLTSLRGVHQVCAAGDTLPEFDYHCPLLSLPLAVGTRLKTIPCGAPYLSAAPDRVSRWMARVGPRTRPRVGLVWMGRAAHTNDRRRSLPLSSLAPLLGQGIELISLQKDMPSSERSFLTRQQDILHLGDELKDFSDTAALVSLLDLVVSVDTSAAHLAGALGMPVWVLLPFAPDWRWLMDRDTSPWYPTARLFRQPHDGDWGSVLQRVAMEVHQLFGTQTQA